MRTFHPHKGIELNPLQLLARPHTSGEANLIVSAPTSSGKTIVAEMAMLHHLRRGERVIYVAPLKSLSSEKIEEWRHWPWRTSIITSDHRGATFATLTIITLEALDAKSRSKAPHFKDVGLIVVDEAHILGTPGRGDALEMALIRLTHSSPVRIIFLSATLSNPHELADWLTRLNRRPTEVIQTDWRPVHIEDHFHRLPNKERTFDAAAIARIREILLSAPPGAQTLIFVHTISKGQKISKAFGIPFHNARLSRKERAELEGRFRARDLQAMVSTSTLAMGVNLPADIGVIVGAHRGLALVDPLELKQMRGRIGRYGLSERGDVHWLIKDYMFDQVVEDLRGEAPVRSVLHQRLHFHVISLIAREGRDPIPFLQLSFGHITPHDIHRALEALEEAGCLRDGVPTALGRAAALFYCDPLDLSAMYQNLRSYPRTPVEVAKAIANVPSLEYSLYAPEDLPLTLPYVAQSAYASALFLWLSGQSVPASLRYFLTTIRQDFERWAEALALAGLRRSYTSALALAVHYGVPLDVVELCKLPGIGRARAMKLWNAGFRGLEDLRSRRAEAEALLGKKVVEYIRPEGGGEGKVRVFWK